MVAVGEAYLGKVRFVDGAQPRYSRPYLVVEVLSNGVNVVNVSSSEGKEDKILKFPTNYPLTEYNPPFRFPSFVKLDSKSFVSFSDLATMRCLSGGTILNSSDLQFILKQL